MRILSIGADRSKRGILHPGTDAYKRQEAYAKAFGQLDIIAFSLAQEGAKKIDAGALRIFPTNSSSKLWWGWAAKRIARTLPRPDVVSVQDPFETGLAGYFLARYFKVPLHVQVHTDLFSPAYAQHSVLNKMRVRIADFVLRRASRIRVVSDHIRTSLAARPGLAAAVTVLPIFADLSLVRRGVDPTLATRFAAYAQRVLVVSRSEPEKNIELAITSFAQSAPKDACLIIVGDGSEQKKLQMLAQDSGVSDRVFFEGGRDAAAYYALVDLVLVPSKYEGYGLVIVEALAAGKPVIATDVGVAREAGAIISPSEHFAETLADWFANGPRAGSLKSYPYKNFDEYVRAYCADILACAGVEKA